MRFLVLGPLEVEADNGPVVLGGQKERLLLALLLARPNQVVSVEALVLALWGDHPPLTAAKTLQSHVVRLRRALEPARVRGAASQVLVTRQPGYLLRVPPRGLDAARLEEQAAKGRRGLNDGQAERAGSLLRQALGLQRGQGFEEFFDSDVAVAEADRLAELRLDACNLQPNDPRLAADPGHSGLFCGRSACDRGSLPPTRQGLPSAKDAQTVGLGLAGTIDGVAERAGWC